jgi:hypothetical protein
MNAFYVTAISVLISTSVFSQELSWDYLQTSEAKPKGTHYAYRSKDGNLYTAGTRIKLGHPSSGKVFSYVQQTILLDVAQATMADASIESEIVNFRVGGSKRSGYKIWMKSKGVIGVASYIIDLENALETGEVRSVGSKSDQAMAELKRAKDKLDLGLITQDEYDDIKAELAPIIK